MRFAPAPRVPGLPHPRHAAQALRRGRSRGAGDGAAGRGGRTTRGRRRHPHAGARAGGRSRGRAGGDAGTARVPGRRAGVPALRAGCAAARAPSSGARCGTRCAGRVGKGERQGRDELNETRRRLGLAPQERVHGGLSDRLVLVGTYPQLEYPRDWPPHVHVVGPLLWEPPFRARRAARRRRAAGGGRALDLAGPAAAHAAGPPSRGWADARVRVLATLEPAPAAAAAPGPAEHPLRRVDLLLAVRAPLRPWWCATPGTGRSCGRSIPRAVVVAVPVGADMGENAARLDWAGLGVRLPGRLVAPRDRAPGGRARTRRPGLSRARGHRRRVVGRARRPHPGGGARRKAGRGIAHFWVRRLRVLAPQGPERLPRPASSPPDGPPGCGQTAGSRGPTTSWPGPAASSRGWPSSTA